MTIRVVESKLHWNYFLALECDMEQAGRYIEFTSENFRVYTIELRLADDRYYSHILLE